MRHLMSSCCPGSCKSGEDRSTSFAPYIELILNAAETLTSDSPLFEVFRPSSSNIFPPEFSCCCLCISTFRLHSVLLLFLLFFFPLTLLVAYLLSIISAAFWADWPEVTQLFCSKWGLGSQMAVALVWGLHVNGFPRYFLELFSIWSFWENIDICTQGFSYIPLSSNSK